MKKVWIALMMLMLTVSLSAVSTVPRHRHHPQTEASATKGTQGNQPIDAFSDTTSASDDSGDEDSADVEPASVDDSDDQPSNDVFHWVDKILDGTVGFGGILFATVVVILVFLFLTSPFIVIALIVWWLIKRRNKRLDLAQKAVEHGQPIPESDMPIERQSDKYLMKRGLRNGFLGLGLMIMFWFWNASFLAGIAALVFVYGAGQAFIAWASENNVFHRGMAKGNEQKADPGKKADGGTSQTQNESGAAASDPGDQGSKSENNPVDNGDTAEKE